MSYELVDDFVRQADARPEITKVAKLARPDLTPRTNSYHPAKTKFGAQPPNNNIMKRPAYLCPELGRTCHRPGAYDAYDLPSLYNGELKPYRFKE